VRRKKSREAVERPTRRVRRKRRFVESARGGEKKSPVAMPAARGNRIRNRGDEGDDAGGVLIDRRF